MWLSPKAPKATWTRLLSGSGDADCAAERMVGQPETGPSWRMSTIQIRLGHESVDVTLAYLKGKDAESEEAQEHANSSSLALYA